MIDSPVNFSHWHTEPALVGGLLFVAWVYAILVGPFRKDICPINLGVNLRYFEIAVSHLVFKMVPFDC